MTIIKNTIPQIVKPLIYLFNKSFETGQFPNMMKKAKIIPIFKSGDKNTFTNYRPVSLLPQFSKILEKLFQIRLEKCIDRNNIISESQYGFRRNCSTNLAIIDLIEEITTSLDKKKNLLEYS